MSRKNIYIGHTQIPSFSRAMARKISIRINFQTKILGHINSTHMIWLRGTRGIKFGRKEGIKKNCYINARKKQEMARLAKMRKEEETLNLKLKREEITNAMQARIGGAGKVRENSVHDECRHGH